MATDPVAFAEARLDEEAAGIEASIEDQIEQLAVDGIHADRDELLTPVPNYEPMWPRPLRDVEAGRRILARHTECATQGTGPCREFPVGEGVMCRELADLLYRWADHPDYEHAWKPQQ